MILGEDIYLKHFGVKGMRWGVRKSNSSSSKAGGKPGGKRAEKKAARRAADQKKANDLIGKALKDPDVLINLNGRTIVTGKEFVNHLANGGLLSVKMTKVYAELDKKNKTYVLQP